MAEHNELGKWGEQKAAEYLISQGYYIRHRDWKFKHRDIDIVAIDEDETLLIFVEVKTRSSDIFGAPNMAITPEKSVNIMIAANAYLRTYKLEHMAFRYDSISIVGTSDDNFQLEHQKDIIDITIRQKYRDIKQAKKRFNRPGTWSRGTWR